MSVRYAATIGFSCLILAVMAFSAPESMAADEKAPPSKPKIDWTRITLDFETIKALLNAIQEKIVKPDVLKSLAKAEDAKSGDGPKSGFARGILVEHKMRLEVLIKNPDLEEASTYSKKWFLSIYGEMAAMDSFIDKLDAAISNGNQEAYAAALAEFNAKRAELKKLLASPVKLTKDQLEAVKSANEKRRAKYAEQLKKSQGK